MSCHQVHFLTGHVARPLPSHMSNNEPTNSKAPIITPYACTQSSRKLSSTPKVYPIHKNIKGFLWQKNINSMVDIEVVLKHNNGGPCVPIVSCFVGLISLLQSASDSSLSNVSICYSELMDKTPAGIRHLVDFGICGQKNPESFDKYSGVFYENL